MMMIDMRCPHCDTAYRLKSELAGRQVKCRSCQGTFTVEESDIAEEDLMSIQIPAARVPRRTVSPELPSTKEFSSPGIRPAEPPARPPVRPVRKGPKVDDLGFFVDVDDDDDHDDASASRRSAGPDPYDEAELLRAAARKGAEALYEDRKPKPRTRAATAGRGPNAATVIIRLGLGMTGIAVAAILVYLGVRMISTAGIRAALAGLPYEIQAEFEQSSDTPIGSPAPPEAKIDSSLPVRDLSKHRRLLGDLVSDFEAMGNAIAQINDAQSAEAVKPRIDEITKRLQGLQARVRSEQIFQPNPKEDQILSKEFGKPLRTAGEKIRDQLRRLQSISNFPLAMSGAISQVNFGLSQMERQFISKGELPPGDKYAEIRVAGLKSEEERAYIQELITELANPRASRKKTSSLAATRYAIWPVDSVSQLSRSINFGKVIRTSGKEVWVVADPIPPETLAERRTKREAAIAESKSRVEQAKKETEERVAEARRASGEVDIPKDADDVTRGLLMATRSTNVFQRRQGVELLGRVPLGDRKPEVLEAMENMLDESDPFALKAVVSVIRKCDVSGQLDVLHKALKNRSIRDDVVSELAERKSPDSVEPLILALERFGNESIVNTLISYGPSIESTLIPFLGDSREEVRKGVCEVLAGIGGDETLAAMKKLPPDSSFFVRNAATETINRIQSRKVLSGGSSKEPGPKKYETTGTGKIVISPNRKSSSGAGKAGGPQP